jgi:preprotein translocase subunit SecY
MEDYKNQSVYEELDRWIPTATMLGGITIGLLTILGDMLNSSASSTSLLLAVNTIYSFYDKLEGLRG